MSLIYGSMGSLLYAFTAFICRIILARGAHDLEVDIPDLPFDIEDLL